MKHPTFWILLVAAAGTTESAPAAPSAAPSHFEFRAPQHLSFRVDEDAAREAGAGDSSAWMKAWPADGSTNFVELGSRVVLQLANGSDLGRVLQGSGLELSRTITSNVFILQARDAHTAARAAQRLATSPGVRTSHPVQRRPAGMHGPYSYQPSDNLFYAQWPLDHHLTNGISAGIDLNVRAAWPYTTGEGVTIAVVDSGVELNHPELVAAVTDSPHFNFATGTYNGSPINRLADGAHGTQVAGLIAAQLNTARITGVAPGSKLASWAIFNSGGRRVSDEVLMDVYQYLNESVEVQNHSWGNDRLTQVAIPLLEDLAIENAVKRGRSGRGVIMVRSAGNDRAQAGNANDDGYPSDPRAIAVAAVRLDGRVAGYSAPGACVLVAAPSGDPDVIPAGLLTTDLLGTDGVNVFGYLPPNQDLSGYVFNAIGFSGTSAAAPQVAGIVGMMLALNPGLTWRDVQQILIFSSRHSDLADSDLSTNGAGFRVSHNVGFGVPDAGAAVTLARNWINRPPRTTVTFTATNPIHIPDDGLRVLVTGTNIPGELRTLHTLPSTGPHADAPTPALPLVFVGLATNPISLNLTNRGALIERGTNFFSQKIQFAAQAGAAFAIIHNYETNTSGVGAPGGDQLTPMAGTDFVPIPAVFIGYRDGRALRDLFQTNTSARAQIHLDSAPQTFNVTNMLLCEHVQVRVQTDHDLRGDVRITLVSPAGTRSVLQRYNTDTSPGPVDWTYSTTHHFFESTAGPWTVYFSDEGEEHLGTVLSVSLILSGVPIFDTDRDGLDDIWELIHFACLNERPGDDADEDGSSAMREQIMGTDPNVRDVPFQLDVVRTSPDLARLSWPGNEAFRYEIWGGPDVTSLTLITNIPGIFPETEWFLSYRSPPHRSFRVRAVRP